MKVAKRQVKSALAGLLAAVAVLSGCASTVSGRAVSVYDDPFQVAGLPTTSGPSGPRPGVPGTGLTAVGGDHGDLDRLALDALDDIQTFWQGAFARNFDGAFAPLTTFRSWDARAPQRDDLQFCGESTYQVINAAYCRLDNTIGWDRGVLLPMMNDDFGPMAVVMVLAHEYGHAVQNMAHLVAGGDPVLVKEQQADCFAGVFMRHVAEGGAQHFTINTSDGLNKVLAATVAIRDANPGDPEAVHGSAFERVTAVQIGFTDGPKSCKAIDVRDVNRRRKNLPQNFGVDDSGETEVSKSNLVELTKAMAAVLPISKEPTYDYHGATLHCLDGADTRPVTYCPATNTIGIDLPALARRGAPDDPERDGFPTHVGGDYNAYVVLVSRYALAVQESAHQQLAGPKPALRAACLSGVITAKLADPKRAAGQGDISLSVGDLDKAVSGLLTDGLAASDVDGRTVPSGFSRVDAFRAGVLGSRQTCESRYA
ncbi:neutral zinc metallopeptidase [Nocardia aurantia]|uniref:Metallopeptidase n=1 Tax=Nocardia aurantia TaxID=2585199 RepID=A0A7K0DJV2_9NOCA|nr:metallopeptidase [Nocardia aurantia]MQY25064.1 hypothetical protein [Nocardia aurantia]